jgi:nucleoside-diphosphate-sugar epimerase
LANIIFITGATGFIGNNLAHSLASAGNNLHVLVRPSSNQQGLHHPNIKIFTGDLTNSETVYAAMQGCNQVYHLGGLAKMWMKDRSEYDRVNVGGTENILTASTSLGIEKVLLVATAGFFPPVNSTPVNESAAVQSTLHTAYEHSKYKARELANSFFQKGLPIVFIYPTNVFGAGLINDGNTVAMMIRDYIKGKWKFIPGSGKGVMNYVYIDDVVDGMQLAMQKAKPGSHYILGGENASYDEFFSLVKELSGINRQLFHIPFPLIRTIAAFEDAKSKWFGMTPLITAEWVKKIPFNWSKDVSKAKRELDYNPVSLREGITKTIEWLKRTDQI